MNTSLERLKSIGFDMNRIAELVELFESQEEVFTLIDEMYTESSVIVPEIFTCIEQRDYQSAMQKLHYLKGVALGVGAELLAQTATSLESRLRDNNQCADELDKFKITWDALSQEIIHK
jgi:HPt (histidine-containing phosphotransfer) domain-containing protein